MNPVKILFSISTMVLVVFYISACGTPDEIEKKGVYKYKVPDGFDSGKPKLGNTVQYENVSGVGLNDKDIVFVYTLELPGAPGSIKNKALQKQFLQGISTTSGGNIDSSQLVQVDDKDALQVNLSGITSKNVKNANANTYSFFIGKTMYNITCRWADDKKDQLLKGCDEVVKSLKVL